MHRSIILLRQIIIISIIINLTLKSTLTQSFLPIYYSSHNQRNIAYIIYNQHLINMNNNHNHNNNMCDTNQEQNIKASSCYEIEQKFAISNHHSSTTTTTTTTTTTMQSIQEKLLHLGFQPKSNEPLIFMDWYFDIELHQQNYHDQHDDVVNLQWILSKNDYWLRYREVCSNNNLSSSSKKKYDSCSGKWQLKRGIPKAASSSSSSTTIYEEIEGKEAIHLVYEMIVKYMTDNDIISSTDMSGFKSSSSLTSSKLFMDGYQVPIIPHPSNSTIIDDTNSIDIFIQDNLKPFARIETTRSSWRFQPNSSSSNNNCSSKYKGLSVDLDYADFGYMVGEVEVLILKNTTTDHHLNDATTNDEEAFRDAKERIQSLISSLVVDHEDRGRDHTIDCIQQLESPSSSRINKNETVILGKLETYLKTRRLDHYNACISSGSLKS